MKRITYMMASTAAPQAAPEPRRDTLGEKVRSALVVGLCVFFALSSVIAGIAVGVMLHSGIIGWLIIVLAIASILIACSFAFEWAIKVGGYDWRTDADERQWRRDWEENERKWQREQVERSRELPQHSPIDRLDITAFTLLNRHFAGQPTTRDACTPDLMTQADWNLATAAFKALDWKKGNTFKPGDDQATAWAEWQDRILISGGEVLIKTGMQWQKI